MLDSFWSGVTATLLAEIVLLGLIYLSELRRRRVSRRRTIAVAFSRAALEIRIARDDGLFARMWAEKRDDETRAFLSRFRDSLMEMVSKAERADYPAVSWMLLELQFAQVEPFVYFQETSVKRRVDAASAAWQAPYGPGPAGGEAIELPDPTDVSSWITRRRSGTGSRMTYYSDSLIPSRRKHVEEGNHFPPHFIGLEIVGFPGDVKSRTVSIAWDDRFELRL